MSDPNYTHIVLLVDASGSMEPTKQATIDGINRFIREQKNLANEDRKLSVDADFSEASPNLKCTINLVFFASEGNYQQPRTGEPHDWFGYHKFIDHKDIKDVVDLTEADYNPNGGTPLIDAFCKAIRESDAFINTLPEAERPGRVIYVSLTDGEENASRTNKKDDLNKLITAKQALNRQFIYLGANQDAIQESSAYGVAKGQSLNYTATNQGYNEAFAALSSNVMRKRSIVDSTMMFACSIADDARDMLAGGLGSSSTGTAIGSSTNSLISTSIDLKQYAHNSKQPQLSTNLTMENEDIEKKGDIV